MSVKRSNRVLVIGTKGQLRIISKNPSSYLSELNSEDKVEYCSSIDNLSEFLRYSLNDKLPTRAPTKDEAELHMIFHGLPLESVFDERNNNSWNLPIKVFYTGSIRQYDPDGQGMTVNSPEWIKEKIDSVKVGGLLEENIIKIDAPAIPTCGVTHA